MSREMKDSLTSMILTQPAGPQRGFARLAAIRIFEKNFAKRDKALGKIS
jgi:hypothetical protein